MLLGMFIDSCLLIIAVMISIMQGIFIGFGDLGRHEKRGVFYPLRSVVDPLAFILQLPAFNPRDNKNAFNF